MPLRTHHQPIKNEITNISTYRESKLSVVLKLAAVILLLLIFLHGHGWAQGVKATGQDSYDPVNKAQRVNVVVGGGTGGGPADVGATTAASETDAARQKVTSAIRVLDTSQAAGSQLVTAKGDQTSGLWVNCKSGCAGGSTTPADTFANPTTAGISFNFPAVWNGTTWDRLYGDKTNGAFVQLKSTITVPVSGTFWQATQPVSGTFFQATQPVSIADAADTTLGAKADAKSTATDTTAITLMQVMKEISAMEQAPASRAVTNAGTFAVQIAANSSVNQAQVGGTAVVADPCQSTAKLYDSFSGTANTQLITGTSAKKIYFCSFSIIVGAATNVAIVSGTGTVCATGITKFLSGGTTAATGWNFAANGGLVIGNGGAAVAVEANNADNVCVLVSAANQTNINYSYVVQ